MTRLLLVLAILVTGCGAADPESRPSPSTTTAAGGATPAAADPATPGTGLGVDGQPFPPAPETPTGPLDPAVDAMIDAAFDDPPGFDFDAAAQLEEVDDPRILWLVSDYLRFAAGPSAQDVLTDVAESVGGLDLSGHAFVWGPLTDVLLAWDLPAYDGYAADKARLFTAVEPGWQPFFDDADATIDWRQTSWGGVLIDDRPLGDGEPCERGCIPSLDDPPVVPAEQGGYYPDDRIVFGVVVNGEAVAFPKNIMEVHEMVNATIGDRRIAMPYCTLCGAAQVYFTDPEGGGTGEIVMRTSGLLRRSNKVMYDLTTTSVFDTFTGEAVSGPLLDQGVVLAQAPVVTSTWGAWKAAHPDTTIVAEDGGIGRSYPLDPLRGRDDDGPIFPIGDLDQRLDVHQQVLGVVVEDGVPLAFPVEQALTELEAGGIVELQGVRLAPDAGGVIATRGGQQLAAHQAFWFAWSQFHPDTLLWTPGG